MNRRIVVRIVLGVAVVLGACTAGTEPDATSEGLTVEARPGVLVLSNTSARAVRYVGLVSGALALVTGPEEWPELAPGTSAELPNDELIGYTPDATRASIRWAVDGRLGHPIEVDLR